MGFLLNQILSNGVTQQEAVNTSRANTNAAVGRASTSKIASTLAQMENDRLVSEISALKKALESGDTSGLLKAKDDQIAKLRQSLKEKDQIIARKDDLIRQWMISQTAFKNLFKRFGILSDGRKAGSLPDEERLAMVAEEKNRVETTGEGLATPEVRAIVLGK